MVSPRVKFIAITVDELILVPVAWLIIYYLAQEWFWISVVVGIIGAAIFVAGKYYLIYPELQEGSSHKLYDLKGINGKVIATVTPTSGKIKVGQEIWEARCDSGEISVGTEVEILARESMKVRVVPAND